MKVVINSIPRSHRLEHIPEHSIQELGEEDARELIQLGYAKPFEQNPIGKTVPVRNVETTMARPKGQVAMKKIVSKEESGKQITAEKCQT